MEKKELPCDVVQDLLELYVDNAVKETTRGMVAKHLANFPHYTNGMWWSSEVVVNKDGVGYLKHDIKHPLLSKKGESFERFQIDYSEIEGDVPDEIQFNGEVIWSKRDNEKDTIPEFVQHDIAGEYEIVDFNGYYYDMTLSDGKHLYLDGSFGGRNCRGN